MKACFVFYLLIFTNFCFGEDFSIVSGVLSQTSGDVLAAFGDFNADKLIDIFVINQAGQGIDVLLAQDKKQFERKVLLTNVSLPLHTTISGIMVADFNGDVVMDVLVSMKKESTSSTFIALYWGNGTGIDTENPFTFKNESFIDEPVLFDFNADMIPDLLMQGKDGQNIVWQATGSQEKNFSKVQFPSSFSLQVPHSSAFIDLDNDFNADLIVTTVNNKFEVFTDNNFNNSNTITNIDEGIQIGQSSFADFNQDGCIDHVVPACKLSSDGTCTDSFIYFRDGKNKTRWERVSDPFSDEQFVWTTNYKLKIPVTLRVGDYDMDGYPDLLVILYSQKQGGTKPFFLKNELNETGQGRKFVLQRDVLPSSLNSTLLATFYDYSEDGMPDVVLTSLTSEGIPYTVLIKNNLALDTCFLKVTVVSGLCSDNCPKNRKPYGVNVPGPTVVYKTTQANGNKQLSSAGQLSQSAHFALQLPFVSFGLGQTPNFVDQVGVGIPTPNDKKMVREKNWTQIIPNAQLIVNPNPVKDPSSWRMQLFVVPSQQIYLTGIALLSTCVLLALIVGLLLWNEKREDKREKKNDSQKFHFDAM